MYIVVEIQETTEGGTPITTNYVQETLDEAMSKYHYILYYAAISQTFRHTAVVMSTDGKYIARESYKHPTLVGENNG